MKSKDQYVNTNYSEKKNKGTETNLPHPDIVSFDIENTIRDIASRVMTSYIDKFTRNEHLCETIHS